MKDIYFYTGVPDDQDDNFWHNFWTKKLSYMGRSKIRIFSRSLRYHNKSFTCPSCNTEYSSLIGHEKGIDVRLALDVIRLANDKVYDVAVILSQDQDLREVAEEVVRISKEQNRWIKVASAFPVSPTYKVRGIDKTDWIKISKVMYDACVDPRDYRS
ncbi:MAG TPA: NYN domain-containing protein [Candidatus Bathyarchaeia archaeon]|nr:NYN domain-containing protein [Candidatus Bathyarchaeia archaeon]